MSELKARGCKRLLSMFMALVMCLSLLPTYAFAADPSALSSTLNGMEFVAGESKEYTFTTTAGADAGEMVIGKLETTSATGKVEYKETDPAYVSAPGFPWFELPASGEFGPSTGFPLSDATSTFRATFDTPGAYTYTVSIIRVSDDTVLCSQTGSFTVAGKVKFKANASGVYEMPDTQIVAPGGLVTEPDEPSREGYVFGGWYKEAACTNAWDFATDTVTANTTLYAKWTEIPADSYFTVSYMDNGGSVYNMPLVNPVSVKGGDNYTVASAPSRDGYTFIGWYTDGSGSSYAAGEVISAVDADYVLYARWEEVVVKHTVTFPTADGTEWSISKHGNMLVNDGASVMFSVKVEDGYDPATMVVTYTVGGDQIPLAAGSKNGSTYYYTITVTEDTTVEVTAPAALTYKAILPVSETVTAKFTAVDGTAYTGTNMIETVSYDGSFEFTVGAKDGYTVTAVYANGVLLTDLGGGSYKVENVKADTTITVDVTAKTFYVVNYIVDNAGYANFQQVEAGTNLTAPQDPTKTGYTFNGWYTDEACTGTKWDFAANTVTADTWLYGKLIANTYAISYDVNGGTGTIPDTTKTYGQAVQLTETVPTRTGYTFLGWSKANNAEVASYASGATFSEEIDADLTLYAVWKVNTYTVTLPNGTGFTASSTMSPVVEYDGSYTFYVTVDRDYATETPVVMANGTVLTANTATPNADQSVTYEYTIDNIIEDQIVSVTVAKNATFQVTFKTVTDDDTPIVSVYQTQEVEDSYCAAQPADPVIEGYTFEGWFTDDTFATPYDFATPVTGATTIYGKMVAIKPVVEIPAEAAGYTDNITDPATTDITSAEKATVGYGDDVYFTVTVKEGYDASAMQVGANGQAIAPVDVTASGNDTVYTYVLSHVERDTKVTVVGIVRKTVVITYMANARDDVSGMPAQQVIKYYLTTDFDTITAQVPVRTGYAFLGWNADSEATAAAYVAGNAADFTADTVLYAIWQAVDTTIELAVSNVAKAEDTDSDSIDDTWYEYEDEMVTLTATLSTAVSTGSVIFYKNDEVIGQQAANGSDTYTLEAKTGAYAGTDTYKVEYKAESDEGFAGSASATVDVTILSTAISWKLNGTAIAADANTLGVYTDEACTTAASEMIANSTYWLKLPAVYALDDQTAALEVNKDYTVTWQYKDAGNDWKDYTAAAGGDTVKILPEYSKYTFKAVVEPVVGTTSHFTKAAKYDTSDALVSDEYLTYLETKPTAEVKVQATDTKLAITGKSTGGVDINEAATVLVNGASDVFAADHQAQFEGQKVTLTATVINKNTTKGVELGSVEFYQNGELIATVPVQTEGADMGKASFEATMNAFTGTDATAAKDVFYAKYVKNETYDESASADSDVYIKSTEIMTPVVEADEYGTLDDVAETSANATAYDYNLVGLTAGVEHVFTLRAGGTAADYSVVAKDGRVVKPADYSIEWQTKTGDNFTASGTNDVTEFKTTDNKIGNQYRVALTAKGDMTKGAESKYVEIGTLQQVTVEVVASDEIKTTPETDVYQLNDITLTATVEGADPNCTMLPTGTVTFYYELANGKTVKLGDAALAKATDGTMKASITTNELPVLAGDNTKLDVTVTAVYEGDETFAKSGEFVDEASAITDTVPANVTDDFVTVYSSVVFVSATDENWATTSLTADGIHISVKEGTLAANETNVTLSLADIYTLDHAIDLSKLKYGVDYTVQWQMLTSAAAENVGGYYGDATGWNDITSANGINYTIGTVEQDAAYRAVITVKDTPIAQGSYTFVDQDIDGRQVYYSNVLVVGLGDATVTVVINTSKNEKFNEEGIVEGEKVTINTLVSGAVDTTPINEVTAEITDIGGNPVKSFTEDNVDGWTDFVWDTTGVTPGYYTLTVTATSNNGYADKTITRTLIVRDDNYTVDVDEDTFTYDGKVQGLKLIVNGMDIESALASKSWTVTYKDASGKMVEPTQAGTYDAVITMPASRYWTEKTFNATLTIEKRDVKVTDLVAQAKVYDGTTDANVLDIVLGDAEVDPATGLPMDDIGLINGDSLYAVGVAYTDKAAAGTAALGVKNVKLMGDDAANYNLADASYTEEFIIMRNQLKGDIADSTYKYTGSSITVPAEDIIVIDQQGNAFTAYDVTYYYHNGEGVEKVEAMKAIGLYTVVVTPKDTDNYKGGAAQKVYVAAAADDQAPTAPTSATISIANTVELYGAAGNTGVVVSATKGTASVEYYVSGSWTATAPTDAGRYLVKASVTNGTVTDTAYGLYTIVKARPQVDVTAETPVEYTSLPYAGSVMVGFTTAKSDSSAEVFYTYSGDTVIGLNPNVNVDYQAPTEVGKYIVTAHIGETKNYTAHEVSAEFEITKKALTVTADSWTRWQYGAFPDMTATFEGFAVGVNAPDNSFRDVQVQPEFLFNYDKGGFTNHALDQVGEANVKVTNGLIRNYEVTYVDGLYKTDRVDPQPTLDIHGLPDNDTAVENVVYYGDVIQLYAYGDYVDWTNPSSFLEWKTSDTSIATIDAFGILKVVGVGDFSITLTRGTGVRKISVTVPVTAKKQEVKVFVPNEDVVYSGAAQNYTIANMEAYDAKFASVTASITDSNKTRTDIGSQIVTGQVAATEALYQSDVYGGLYTINDKDIVVAPLAQTTVYGTKEAYEATDGTTGGAYSETSRVGGVAALTGAKVASVDDLYDNLDVLDGYEILVAGVENINYNVHYTTDAAAEDAEVTAKPLTIKTGVYEKTIGQTGGSLNPAGDYPADDAAELDMTGVDLAATFNQATERMYGEPNQVMSYLLETLVAGDSEADLTALIDWLVAYSYKIPGDANKTYDNKLVNINPAQYPTYTIPTTGFDITSAMQLTNYDVTVNEGTQNIYQRPVTLTPKTALNAFWTDILDTSTSPYTVKEVVLLQMILNNFEVGQYHGEGGLAELLNHTIDDLDLYVENVLYDDAAKKITADLKVGNPNYWIEGGKVAVTINVETSKIEASYGVLYATFQYVTMNALDKYENVIGPVDLGTPVTFYVYAKNDSDGGAGYSFYKNETPIRTVIAQPTGRTGVYIARYSTLPNGRYVTIAIAEGYTIIE